MTDQPPPAATEPAPVTTQPGELITNPPAAVEPPAVTNCRLCVVNKAQPGKMFCVGCEARRNAAKAAAEKAKAPPPPVRAGGARLAGDLARLVPPSIGEPPAVRPRVLPPVAAGRKCCQCEKVMSEHPDPEDTPSRCGKCVRKNRDDLRRFTRGEG